MTKILVIRFSSIGDIVLTTPVIRCLKEQAPGAEIHYLTRKQYIPILQSNPHISKIHIFKDNFQELIPRLKAERFDRIADLHCSLRSRYVRFRLGRPSGTFPKLDLQKWMLTKLRIDILPRVHVVDRYFHAVRRYGVRNDGKGLDYFLTDPERVDIPERFPGIPSRFIAVAIGARHNTKIFPAARVAELCDRLPLPVVLLGGKEDMARGEEVSMHCRNTVVSACGLLPLNASASVIMQSELVISNDTGLMHIAAALKRPVISIWGNTVPAFGMYPYFPDDLRHLSTIVEQPGLACRPCSKLGYPACPMKHFDCMEKIEIGEILKHVRKFCE